MPIKVKNDPVPELHAAIIRFATNCTDIAGKSKNTPEERKEYEDSAKALHTEMVKVRARIRGLEKRASIAKRIVARDKETRDDLTLGQRMKGRKLVRPDPTWDK